MINNVCTVYWYVHDVQLVVSAACWLVTYTIHLFIFSSFPLPHMHSSLSSLSLSLPSLSRLFFLSPFLTFSLPPSLLPSLSFSDWWSEETISQGILQCRGLPDLSSRQWVLNNCHIYSTWSKTLILYTQTQTTAQPLYWIKHNFGIDKFCEQNLANCVFSSVSSTVFMHSRVVYNNDH